MRNNSQWSSLHPLRTSVDIVCFRTCYQPLISCLPRKTVTIELRGQSLLNVDNDDLCVVFDIITVLYAKQCNEAQIFFIVYGILLVRV